MVEVIHGDLLAALHGVKVETKTAPGFAPHLDFQGVELATSEEELLIRVVMAGRILSWSQPGIGRPPHTTGTHVMINLEGRDGQRLVIQFNPDKGLKLSRQALGEGELLLEQAPVGWDEHVIEGHVPLDLLTELGSDFKWWASAFGATETDAGPESRSQQDDCASEENPVVFPGRGLVEAMGLGSQAPSGSRPGNDLGVDVSGPSEPRSDETASESGNPRDTDMPSSEETEVRGTDSDGDPTTNNTESSQGGEARTSSPTSDEPKDIASSMDEYVPLPCPEGLPDVTVKIAAATPKDDGYLTPLNWKIANNTEGAARHFLITYDAYTEDGKNEYSPWQISPANSYVEDNSQASFDTELWAESPLTSVEIIAVEFEWVHPDHDDCATT